MRTNTVLLLGAVIIGAFLYLKNTTLFTATLFEREAAAYQAYIAEDFSGYDQNSEILDTSEEDLSRWQHAGALTAWTDIQDWSTVQRIDIELTDANGAKFRVRGIENAHLPRESNNLASNDAFPDYEFACPNQPIKTWEDFMVVNGTNFLFWEYAEVAPIDMRRIVSWKAFNGDSGEEIEIRDVVIHDGLCADRNSLNGSWSSPNGLPQYGVWWPHDGVLTMRKVEQEQYPSNGDHTRILSSATTPNNFLMRVRFRIDNLPHATWWEKHFGESEELPLKNTYLRFAWDFDDVYDPGHDQSLVYNTFEYNYLGLQRVFPIERYFVQGYEPDQNDESAKTQFSFENGRTYEIQIKVNGQDALVVVYEVHRWYLDEVSSVSYSFNERRPAMSYPFSIEATGNVDITIDGFEVRKRD